MCGRFSLNATIDELIKRYALVFSEAFEGSDEVFPGTEIYNIGPEKRLNKTFWGIETDFLNRPIINTRLEKIYTSDFFRADFEYRRVLIPATSFFEWDKVNGSGDKYKIYVPEDIFSIAGITRPGKRTGISLLTTAANKKMAKIHHRMPVILPRRLEEEYLYSKYPRELHEKLSRIDPDFSFENTSDTQLSFL